MTVIGLVSDAHTLLRPQIRHGFSGLDLILRAGDVGFRTVRLREPAAAHALMEASIHMGKIVPVTGESTA